MSTTDEGHSGLHNQRLKLSARGGRLVGYRSVLNAAAAARSSSAIRYAAPAVVGA